MRNSLPSILREACEQAQPPVRLSRALEALGIARSVWYAPRTEAPRKPGRKSKRVPEEVAGAVRELAERYPW